MSECDRPSQNGGVDQIVLARIDAWVFMAMGAGPLGRTSLTYAMSSLDYLNRTMPTEAEFEASVRRLGAAGFMDVSAKGFKQTRKGGAFLKRFGLRAGIITVMLSLMEDWDGLAVDAVHPDFDFKLKPGEWQTALEAYEARWAKRRAKFRK